MKEVPHYLEGADERLDLRHGLGLIIVRQIVSAHDGTFRIVSGPDKGFKAVMEFQRS